jgi:hydrogenase 3 maturation protease
MKTSRPCWQNSLSSRLANQPRRNGGARIAILGVGNELRGDDAAGVLVARALSKTLAPDARATLVNRLPGQARGLPLQVIEAGAAPEAFTGVLRQFEPDLVLFIDAADMSELPGTIEVIDWQATLGLDTSTHTLPLHLVAQYLVAELGCAVSLIGIQPADTSFEAALSPAVRRAVDEIAGDLPALVNLA